MTIKRILLIQPPVTSFKLGDFTPSMPLGLAYIAGVLEKEGYHVQILDALVEGWNNVKKLPDQKFQIGLSREEIKKRIDAVRPDVVGVSSMFTSQWRNAADIAAAVKEIGRDIPVVVGGAHPTAAPESVISDSSVDFVVVGEGEVTFLQLLKAIGEKSDVAEIKGILYKSNGEVRSTGDPVYIEDLDAIPFPARHLLPLEKYFAIGLSHGGRRRHRRFTSIVTSRGCPAQCVFCSAHKLWGQKYRVRSPENVIGEMRQLKADFGIEELSIEDDNFTLNKERANAILDRMVKEELDIAWDTPNGVAVYALDKPLIRKMKESGCYRINFPIESGNQDFLTRVIKKPLQLDKVPDLVNYARKIGLEISTFFVVGVPGETEETIKDTFRFARAIGVYDPFISIATPYPGSSMLELCRARGYLVHDFDPTNLTINQYNIETPELPIRKFRRILKREGIKMRAYRYLSIFGDPHVLWEKVTSVFKNKNRGIKNAMVKEGVS